MVELKENDTIKKAPAKKAPAKRNITPIQEQGIKNVAQKIASGTDAIHKAEEQEARLDVENQERINKVVDNTKILAKNLKEQDKRLNSIMDTNKTLIEKHKIIKEDNLAIVIPRDYIRDVVESVVLSVNNKLMDSIDEAQEIIDVLDNKEDIEKNLEALKDLGKLKERLEDVEYQIEDLPDTYYVDDEIASQTSEFVNEYDIRELIEEVAEEQLEKHAESFYYNDFKRVEQILGKEINALKEKLNKPNILKRITKVIKRMFSYNFKSKVRFKMFSNNK